MNNDLSGALNAIMSNPELVSSIKSVVSGINETSGNEEIKIDTENTFSGQINPEMLTSIPKLISAISPLMDKMQHSDTNAYSDLKNNMDKHIKLLNALKPYLNDKKGETIELLSQLAEVVSAVNTIAPHKGNEN